MSTRQTTPNVPCPPGPAQPAPREREEHLEQPRPGPKEFFMDIPRAGARERGRTR